MWLGGERLGEFIENLTLFIKPLTEKTLLQYKLGSFNNQNDNIQIADVNNLESILLKDGKNSIFELNLENLN